MNFPCDLGQLFNYTWSLFNHHLSSCTVRVNGVPTCMVHGRDSTPQSPEEEQKGSFPTLNSWALFSFTGFPGGASAKIRDTGSIPVTGRSPAGGHGNLLQYSCLENPRDTGAWQAAVHRVAESQTQLK